jgi:hypothetical protein
MEANRLRRETYALKRLLRASAAHSREQLRSAEASLRRIEARRDDPLPSPWSTLPWKYDQRSLAGVLVSVP